MAALVTNYGGKPIVAPALREVPLESNPQAIAFADALIRGDFDLVILLTGVGTRALLDVVQGAGKRDAFVAALAKTKVVPRGPKPLAVMRELGIAPWVMVPEPNTWRELLTAVDQAGSVKSLGVAVQEYGVSNPEFLARPGVARRTRDQRAGLPLGAAGRSGTAARRGVGGGAR